MVTSVDDPKEVVGSFHALCDAYLVKPVNKASLLRRFAGWVDRLKQRVYALLHTSGGCSHGSSTGPPDLEENRFSIALSALATRLVEAAEQALRGRGGPIPRSTVTGRSSVWSRVKWDF